MSSASQAGSLPTAWAFNKEIIFGEIGALLGAYVAALITSRFTSGAVLIAGSLVPGTLLGGTAFWLIARIAHQRARRGWSVGVLARDISYFTPAASILGFTVYDPVIFFVSHYCLRHGSAVVVAVAAGQMSAFLLFLASMNAYRLILARSGARHL